MTRMPLLPAQCVVTASWDPSGDQAGVESPTLSSTPHWPLPSGFIDAMPPTAANAMRPLACCSPVRSPKASEPSKPPSATTTIPRSKRDMLRLLSEDRLTVRRPCDRPIKTVFGCGAKVFGLLRLGGRELLAQVAMRREVQALDVLDDHTIRVEARTELRNRVPHQPD